MRRRRIFLLVIASVLFLSIVSAVLAREERKVDMTLREGTSMAAALSPDGHLLAIDLFGRIWTLPSSGGAAKPITDELFDARQPAWSPDGKRIAFQSFRDGTWDIWSIARDGSDAKNLTPGPYDDREPHFSHDGSHLAFSSDRSGNYDIWELNLKSGVLRQITKNPANDFMPAYSPDDKEIAFVSDRPSALGVYAISSAGAERLIARSAGVASGPSWSPDGKQIVYNVTSATEGQLFMGGRPLPGEGENVFPFRSQWISASEILYTADGKIKKRRLASSVGETVEFTAAVSFAVSGYTQKHRDFDSTRPRPVNGVVSPAISPDGNQVAFAALGDIWVMPVGGKPKRLTQDSFLDTDPAWSPDGGVIAFSSDRGGTMDIWLHDMRSGRDRQLTTLPGAEMAPAWSIDGSRIAFINGRKINSVSVATGEVKNVRDGLFEPGRPTWSSDGSIAVAQLLPYSSRFREGLNQILVVAGDGAPAKSFPVLSHRSLDTRTDSGPVWSPDGTKMAIVMDGFLWILPVNQAGETSGPPKKLTSELAGSPSWTADSKTILYMATDRLKAVSIGTGRVSDVPVDLSWHLDIPTERMVIHAGMLFDGRQNSTQRDMDVVVEGNRIRGVEPHRAELHSGNVVDASGQTVMPGLIEMHAHSGGSTNGESLGRLWLAYGLTTVRYACGAPYQDLEARESYDAGSRLGPRAFTTGFCTDGTRVYYATSVSVGGPAQLDQELNRAVQLNYDFLKTYVRLPDALQRRAIEFAHRHGMPVTSHESFPAIALGADGVEHIAGTSRRGYSPKNTNMRTYADVIELFARSGTTLTPTATLGNSQIMAARDASYVGDGRFRAFGQALAANQPSAVREEQVKRAGEFVSALERRGGRIVAGTDAPNDPYGVGLHMELAHYQSSGLTPFQALQTATVNAADALGMSADLGTVEPGKLADMLIVDGDPLADVQNARKVRRVIKNGVVYDLETLLGPQQAPTSKANR